MSPQKQQTDNEQYKTLLENLESCKELPDSRGDNIELDEDDERILEELQPQGEQASGSHAVVVDDGLGD